MRRALLIVSILACIVLPAAQLGSYLEFTTVPAPTSATTGPQGPADLTFGLMALVGGGLGFAASVAALIVGLAIATAERRRSWVVAIGASGAVVLIGLTASALVLVGLPRNAYHPLTICLLVPLTTLAFLGLTRRSSTES